VRGDGLLPTWNFQSCALVWQPELTHLHIGVYKTRRGRLGRASRTLLAYEVIPVWCLRPGYRSVPLRAPSGGNYIKDCALLVYVSAKLCGFDTAEPLGARPDDKVSPDRFRMPRGRTSLLPPLWAVGARSEAALLHNSSEGEASDAAAAEA